MVLSLLVSWCSLGLPLNMGLSLLPSAPKTAVKNGASLAGVAVLLSQLLKMGLFLQVWLCS
jgi:hypothetical protein